MSTHHEPWVQAMGTHQEPWVHIMSHNVSQVMPVTNIALCKHATSNIYYLPLIHVN